MRIVRGAARVFVYGTEDEERVVRALLDALGRAGDPEARGKLTRSRIKGHFGAEIILYEGVAKNTKDLRRFIERLREAPAVASTLRDEFQKRLDKDRVLHFRLDKQAAVDGHLAIGSGGDAIDCEIKYAPQGASTLQFP